MVATHLPLVVRDDGPHGVLEGHFAKANKHWQGLAGRETLVVFPGPHSYVSPALYVEELSVPTWNYIAVHAYGTMELVEDEAGKGALLAGLIGMTEPGFGRGGMRCRRGSGGRCWRGFRGFGYRLRGLRASSNQPESAPGRAGECAGGARGGDGRSAGVGGVDEAADWLKRQLVERWCTEARPAS